MNPNHYLAVAIDYLYAARPQWRGDGRHRQDAGVVLDDRPGGGRPRPPAASRCRSASSGSCPGCSTARSASAARSRPGRRSCATTARCGPPTRTASCWPCWPPRSRPSPASRPSSSTTSWPSGIGDRPTPGSTPPATREQKAELGELSPDDVTADRAGRRADHRQADRGARQRRRDRRAEGGHRERLVRGPAVAAPRTSTRSTPSPSAVPSTSRRCRPRPRTSSPPPSAADRAPGRE